MKIKRKVCLVAVDIRSSHNVGAFFRTADGFGASVCLVGISPRPIYHQKNQDDRLPHIALKADKEINKTALGAEKNVAWQYYPDSKTAFEQLRRDGYKIAAIEQDTTSKTLEKLPKVGDLALVFGTEVTGLTSEVLELCDEIYEIPMHGVKESFNVSVSAGIALYQARL